ncbi:bactofilin family protein [Haloarchaeobius sp. DFWS5]|uniref:bactofilin family protein n=1 Tax=Haloarchaeobius sp. DFWS5 TaxID=3446114 RepID=UPI003EBB9ED1
MRYTSGKRRVLVLFVTFLLVLASVPGLVAGESAVAGTYVVDEGETVDGLEVVGATVVVRGTVDGDLSGAAADVRIEDTGVVTGDVNVGAASVTIAGRVDGDVNVGAATLRLLDGAVVGGNLAAGASDATLAGEVTGNVELGADTIRVDDTAVVGGDFRYDGELDRAEGASIAGTVVRDEELGGYEFSLAPSWAEGLIDGLFTVYAFVVNLVVGALLLLVLPGFSRRVSDQVVASPLKTGGVGLLTLLAVPVLLIALALTIIGIPFTIVGALLFALVAWVAAIYGRFAIGSWLVAKAGGDNRWLALVVGLLVGVVFGWVPYVDGVLEALVFLLGLGALALVLYRDFQSRRQRRTVAPDSRSEGLGDDTDDVSTA